MRGVKLIVAVTVTMLATIGTASAACDLTISNGSQAGITEGPTGTFTSTAASAVLDVGTLTDRLSVGNANVNTGTDPCGGQQGNLTISDSVTWSTSSSLTMFSVGDAEFNASLTATDGSAAFAVQASLGVAQPAGTISVAGPTTVNGGAGSVSLTSSGNDFGGPVSSTTNGDLALRDATALVLGPTSSSDADVTSEGALTQTGAISDGGQFEVQGDGGVTLTNASNNFDDLSVSSDGGAATVRDADSVNLRAVEVTGSGAATVTAGNDLIVPDTNTFFTAGAMTLVSDANAGSALGAGGIDIAGDRAITSTAAPVRLYTARRNQNAISALATLNGATFTPGTEFVDSATEVWNTAFPAGTATSPFTIFYKQAAPVTPVDPPTPDTTLTKTPKKKTKTKAGKKKAKVSFEFTSSVAGSTFECSLDGKEAPCTSPFSKKLKKGRHSFSVAASAAGKTDPAPAGFDFKVKLRR